MGLGQVCPGRGEAALAVPAWEGGREVSLRQSWVKKAVKRIQEACVFSVDVVSKGLVVFLCVLFVAVLG